MSPDIRERCDIVIPVWNHLEMTKDCVDSIAKHTQYPYRLVLIDNASDCPAGKYLYSLKQGGAAVIRNEKNQGFVKAVNQGMRFSDAKYICIMNNDTIVTDGWLSEMINILELHPDIGMINPSSNTSCQFPGKLDIDSYAATLRHFKGTYQELYTGRAFAMVVAREVIDRIGYLDEIYGMGYFDDTDYCKRAQKLGYRVVRAKASYVYHRESQSFSKIREKKAIFLQNEKEFVSRWGRYLRVAYVLSELKSKEQEIAAASHINRIARMGYQVWIFTRKDPGSRLDLIDHESIRFFYYPGFLFKIVILYKIWKRKKKKKMHIILTNSTGIYGFFIPFRKILAADILIDSDFDLIENRLKELSSITSYNADIAGV